MEETNLNTGAKSNVSILPINIEPMTFADLGKIKNCLEADFDDLWNSEVLEDELQTETSKYIVAKTKDTNIIVGFAGVKIVVDEAELMYIVTHKSYRHCGVASTMLTHIISMCKKDNIRKLNLEVNIKNTLAINLYKKYNLKEVGLRKKYYNNTDDALLMSVYF